MTTPCPVRRYGPAAALLACACLSLCAAPARADERYYLLIFGSQTTPRLPRYAHTFAALVKACPPAQPGAPPAAQVYQISWLPATLQVRPLAPHPEPGCNIELHQTVRWALGSNQRVYLWGPYEVHPLFAHKFIQQHQWLQLAGVERYKAIDPLDRDRQISNCIHAISDLDPMFGRLAYPFVVFGKSASRRIVHTLHARDIIIGPSCDHSWLLPVLGLDCYPIERMRYHPWLR